MSSVIQGQQDSEEEGHVKIISQIDDENYTKSSLRIRGSRANPIGESSSRDRNQINPKKENNKNKTK